MSTRKSARQFADVSNITQNTTTAMFIRNHTHPEQLLTQVQVLFAQGHLEEALHVIECIIDNYNPLIASPDLLSLQAKIYIELFGFNVDAQSALYQALMLEPSHTESTELQMLSTLNAELNDGLYEQATSKLRQVISQDPKNAYASYVLGNHLFWKNGSLSEAIELLETCVKVRPSFLKAWICLAMAYKKCQEANKAELAFQECLALDSNATNQEFYKKHLQSL